MEYRGYLVDNEGNKYLQEINILKVALFSDIDLTATADYQYIQINLQEDIKLGTKLNFSNNKIVIGAGVRHIKVTANCIIRSTVEDLFGLVIQKNNSNVVRTYGHVYENDYGDFQIPSTILEVSQNDNISIAAYINHKNEEITVRSYEKSTFLQVEVID